MENKVELREIRESETVFVAEKDVWTDTRTDLFTERKRSLDQGVIQLMKGTTQVMWQS